MTQRVLTLAIHLLTSLIGVTAFLYPFWLPVVAQSQFTDQAHAGDAPLLLAVLVGLCFAVLLLEVQQQAINTKTMALLGVLVAITATLRWVENAIPGPGGFTPIFVLIILTGYVYGGRFGFLLGALTLLVSALLTGGIGPWLPYQMFTAGWMGMTAPLCRGASGGLRVAFVSLIQWVADRRTNFVDEISQYATRDTLLIYREIIVLTLFSGLWGFLYGALMNIWFWPFATGDPAQYWQPGVTLGETVRRYALFYLTTSLAWDAFCALGNMLLMASLGAPLVRALRRFHDRFEFQYTPLVHVHPAALTRPIAEEQA